MIVLGVEDIFLILIRTMSVNNESEIRIMRGAATRESKAMKVRMVSTVMILERGKSGIRRRSRDSRAFSKSKITTNVQARLFHAA